jgi:predicted DNA binding protein
MCRLCEEDISSRLINGDVHYLLAVYNEADTQIRTAYLPSDVEEELSRYAASNDLEHGSPIFNVTPRRLQMLVGEVTDSAAAAAGDESLKQISSADLRQRYGRWLVERGIDPTVVMAVGGWSRLSALAAEQEPDAAGIATAFAQSTMTANPQFRAVFDRLEHPVALVDDSGSIQRVTQTFEARLNDKQTKGTPVHELITPAEASWSDCWQTVLSGETWVGRAAVGRGPNAPVDTVSVVGLGRDEQGTSGFLLTTTTGEDSPAVAGGRDRLETIQELAVQVNEQLDTVSTEKAVFRVACKTIAASGPFQCAWVNRPEADGSPGIVVRSEVESDEAVRLQDAFSNASQMTTQTAAVERNGGHRCWLVRVPVQDDSNRDGTLVIGSSVEPTPTEIAALRNLGAQIANAVTAVRWKRLLLADRLLELEFRTDDPASLFVAGSAELGCTFHLMGVVPLDGGSLLYYLTVSGTSPDEVLAFTRDAAESARLVADYHNKSVLEVTVKNASVAGNVIEQGANLRELVAEDGHARIRCEVTPFTDVREFAEDVVAGSPSASLVAKREVGPSVRSPTEFQRSLDSQLTDRQRSVLQAAYHAGYFDWPRGSTAEDIADSIGVSSPTLHNHLRRGQRKLLATFFDDTE